MKLTTLLNVKRTRLTKNEDLLFLSLTKNVFIATSGLSDFSNLDSYNISLRVITEIFDNFLTREIR